MAGTAPAPQTRRSARWNLCSHDPEAASRLSEALQLHPLAARVLCARGFHNLAAAEDFLSPQLASLHDPLLMKDMAVAANRISSAIERRESILLYGDYDVDGTTSVVILKKAIELLGGSAEFHVPHRLKEGYGMRSEVIERAAAAGVRLIISVDTGIRATDVVRQASELGIDVVVTDHHLPEAQLPPAHAVLNPNRPDCGYPEKNLCGAGVTFKLIQLLIERSSFSSSKKAALLDSFLKLVAVATIADIVPLTGENRVIVRRGLAGFDRIRNAGLRELIRVAGLADGIAPSAHQVAFRLAPRINAAGRMANARDVIDLFLTDDENRAKELAAQLDALNHERQEAEAAIIEQILRKCENVPVSDEVAALVFAEPGWHLGVVGIVASRLVERFARPVFVLSNAAEEGYFSGSGRSIPAFHLLEALESMAELFQKFGGHRQAAGLTISSSDIETFRRRFNDYARQCLTPDDMRPQYQADADASLADLTEIAVTQIFGLAPFGFGNPAPVFRAEQVEVAGEPRVLKEGKHLRVPLRQRNRTLFFKAWNFGDRATLFEKGQPLDILFTLEDDPGARSRGYDGWSPSLKDARPAGASN